MNQPQHEQKAGLHPCDLCGMLSHVQEGLCVNCRHKATWPDRTSTGAKAHENGAAALDKCQPGEKPGDFLDVLRDSVELKEKWMRTYFRGFGADG